MHRREFLEKAFLYSAAGLIVPPALRSGSFLSPGLARAEGNLSAPLAGRVLVWINLSGGSDGLNAVVPYTDATYYQVRPTIAIPPGDVTPLTATRGLHPSLAPLAAIWNAGQMAVIEGVGYPNMNLSHFRGTDIWFSGSSEDATWETGWLARYLEAIYPDFPDLLPASPYALQQSFNHRIPLTGARGLTGVVVDDPSTFSYLVNENYPGDYEDTLPNTHGGDELSFLRDLDRSTFGYADAIQAAADAGATTVSYPNTFLGSQLEIVSKLLSGGLETPVFLCAEQGFDTHANQATPHADLLASVGGSIAAFWQDMQNQGRADRVAILTTSEFGRRVEENGSLGTDHGTAAPHLVIGTAVQGGIIGTAPDLTQLDANGNLLVQNDYRNVIATVLRGHFGAPSELVDGLFAGSYPGLGFIPVAQGAGEESRTVDRLHLPEPNPVAAGATARIRFELARPAEVSLAVFDAGGRRVAELARGHRAAGAHGVGWRPEGLPAGAYIVRLELPAGRSKAAKIIVTR